jgi:hypothetical protein
MLLDQLSYRRFAKTVAPIAHRPESRYLQGVPTRASGWARPRWLPSLVVLAVRSIDDFGLPISEELPKKTLAQEPCALGSYGRSH